MIVTDSQRGALTPYCGQSNGHIKTAKESKQGALTNCQLRGQSKELVGTVKESWLAKGTHALSGTE
jgi:hypothetical protein